MSCILIVDDEADLRELLSIYLKMKRFDVIEASSGSEALLILADNKKINLILSDVQMPNGDGAFLLNALKNDLKSSIPIFMLSGGTNKDLDTLKLLGASAVFEKPVNMVKLLSTIQQFIGPEVA